MCEERLMQPIPHKITYYDEHPYQKWATCRCGFRTKVLTTRHGVEDEVLKHDADVQRMRLNLGTRNPSLKSQRDYFRSMAENPNVAPRDRRLWGMLADELDARVENPADSADQPSLF
jgi:hypothetical protein